MKKNLGQTDIEISALGFGCVQLTSFKEKKEALAILEHVFAADITHFDVARLYGFGRAEGILGEFLRGKRHQVTVATKFGFELPSSLSKNPKLISTAKKLLGPFPKLLRHIKNRAAAKIKGGIFTPKMAVESLEISLRELKTDYIDIFLLHEATLTDAISMPLIETLQQQVAQGKIRCFGVASDFLKLDESIPSAYQILQFNDNAADKNMEKLLRHPRQDCITHSIFKPLEKLLPAIQVHSKIVEKFSSQIDVDLSNPNKVSNLLLHYALQYNIHGMVLFSSMNPTHIENNVKISRMQSFTEAQLAGFVTFVDEILNRKVSQDDPRFGNTRRNT